MSSWSIFHRVRYPPFDDKRLNAHAAPIFEKEIASELNDDEIQKVLPPYLIQSTEGWLVERIIVDQDGASYDTSTEVSTDTQPFVELVKQQRRGWYILPNRLHRIARRMISAAVVLLLSTLVYLFLEPLLSSVGIPSIGTKSLQIGLLDYPVLSVIVVPIMMLPLLLRLVANFIDLKRQQDFFRSPIEQPVVEFTNPIVSGEPLSGQIRLPKELPDWKSITCHWQVGTLPPSRKALIELSNSTEGSQPPVGLSTPLPHHWEASLDDGTAGGEDSPIERQDIQGGVFLRPMRFSAEGGSSTINQDGTFSINPPEQLWPGTVNSPLHRIHWEFIVKIKRNKQMPLLWVCPIHVQFPSTNVKLKDLDINDPRTELFFIGER